ncbi:hypothetical protein ACQZV8_17200 [Magnetococcales bacterium HHB-1]
MNRARLLSLSTLKLMVVGWIMISFAGYAAANTWQNPPNMGYGQPNTYQGGGFNQNQVPGQYNPNALGGNQNFQPQPWGGGMQPPQQAQQWKPITQPFDAFQQGYIQVIGFSSGGQDPFRAKRAATIVAYRDLLEQFKGISLQGTTTVGQGMLQNDLVSTQVKGFLRGAQKCGERYHPGQGYAEVCMRLYLRGRGGVYDVVFPLMAKEGLVSKPLMGGAPLGSMAAPYNAMPSPSSMQPVPQPSVTTTASADGLIIELSGITFKPAIENRILNKNGEILFGPSKIASSILVDRGCGGFTNQVDKARGLLQSWGSQSPMVVKAVSSRQGTDVVVNAADSAAIFSADQQKQFLSQAKVVFVIN